ncbi:aldo/keto reductase [Paraflavitalea sp. CAU 1676]|uniref:aldo/keto reductase n=1 Tax=Paraflavitalea sp. CAU 1676 TaxID=3032598 RepID=UPI0023DAE3BC|nr:aldo/keto reductase [Paraflavitalea sp. CAU 1676]MDF2193496.1 aldo/keto reductase [Paraflavitalea sp. CAU 1676]
MNEISWPRVIYGTSGLGNLYTVLENTTRQSIVEACVQHADGLAVFDTAGKYGAGLALESLGQCLRQLKVPKEKVLISNKLGWYRIPLTTPEPTFERGVWKDIQHDAVQRISYEGILACYEQGNALLNGYNAQLVSVHDPDEYLAGATDEADRQQRWLDILDAYRALFELKASGKVKGVGVGSKDWKVIQRITEDIELDWVMIANSMTLHAHPPALSRYIGELTDQGTVVINSAVFNGGFLIGSDYYNYQLVQASEEAHQPLLQWRNEFFSCCEQHQVSPAHACIQFGIGVSGISSIALNTTRAEKVKVNIDMATKPIPASFWNDLQSKGLIQ